MKNLRILVPSDFSDISTNAFGPAAKLAELTGGKITILNAYKTGTPSRTTDDDPKSERNQKLHELATKIIAPELLDGCISMLAEPVEAITERAKDFDIVVMSSHGRTGFSRLMLGSVAEKVIRFSDVPVLVVENGHPFFPMEKILLTTDFSENAYKAYSYAKNLSEVTGAEIHLVYVLSFDMTEPATQIEAFKRTKEKQMKKDIAKHFSTISDKIKPEVMLTRKSVHEALTMMLDETKYNLAIMATLGRTGLEYLRMGSTTANVVRHVKTPVLVVNPNSKVSW